MDVCIRNVALRTEEKVARTTKDNMSDDSNGGIRIDVAIVGRGSGRSKRQDPVEDHCCCLMSHWG